MTLTTAQARDAVMGLIETAWTASGAATENAPLHFANVKSDRPGEDGSSSQAEAWGRVSVQMVESPQSTQGRRRWLTTGILTVQIFTPFGDGHLLGDAFAAVLLNALRGATNSPDGVWYFDATVNEIGQDGPWFQSNVTASFRFQEALP